MAFIIQYRTPFFISIPQLSNGKRNQNLLSFNRKLFVTTLTLDIAISALAHIGVIWKLMPKMCNTPAANGMHTRL